MGLSLIELIKKSDNITKSHHSFCSISAKKFIKTLESDAERFLVEHIEKQ